MLFRAFIRSKFINFFVLTGKKRRASNLGTLGRMTTSNHGRNPTIFKVITNSEKDGREAQENKITPNTFYDLLQLCHVCVRGWIFSVLFVWKGIAI